ncbi:MAG TPA: hypothetical protein VGK64_16140 [Bryobacteraceae bacterium]
MERYVVGFLMAFAVWAQAPGVSVSTVVTLEARRGKTIPTVEAKDIRVEQGKQQRPVTGLKPLGTGDSLQLMLLIDDSARGSFDAEIPTLQKWVNRMPPNAEVAVAYMRNGMAVVTSHFTKDHTAAAKGIRVASGPGNVNPYESMEDAIKKWPQGGSAGRKIVVMISSGIEGLGGGYNSDNPYVTAGIRAAQKASVVVYGIYSPSIGHAGHSLWRSTWGQNFLSQLSDETGGESYVIGFGSPVSFQPFLDSIFERLQHQYLLTFEARPEQKAGLQPVRIYIPEKDASIAAPDKVYVPASL